MWVLSVVCVMFYLSLSLSKTIERRRGHSCILGGVGKEPSGLIPPEILFARSNTDEEVAKDNRTFYTCYAVHVMRGRGN